MSGKVQYSLSYFPVRGRADPIRMVMEAAGLEYTFEGVALDQWKARKEELKKQCLTARGQMPYLQWKDSEGKCHTISQSLAILRYVANVAGFYASDSQPELRAHIDEVVEVAQELLLEVGKLAWNHSPEVAQNWEAQQKTFSDYFKDLESFLAPRIIAPGRLDVESLTLADIFLAFALETAASMFLPELSANAPRLFQFFQDVIRSNEPLLNYVRSDRRAEAYTVSMAARLISKNDMFSWD